jgi:hypothetical protein
MIIYDFILAILATIVLFVVVIYPIAIIATTYLAEYSGQCCDLPKWYFKKNGFKIYKVVTKDAKNHKVATRYNLMARSIFGFRVKYDYDISLEKIKDIANKAGFWEEIVIK